MNLHVHERGSVVFPRETRSDDLLSDRDANLAEPAWRALRAHLGLSGLRRDAPARGLVGDLFRVALAVLHASAYQFDHRSALAADWAHVPIPRDRALFRSLVAAGEQAARLLDANRDATDVARTVIDASAIGALARLSRRDGEQVRDEDLDDSPSAHWGGAKGRWVPRPFSAEEEPHPAWGERTGDLFIGEEAFYANVPEAVWTYQLGGYPVLKKWLGYRQANRRDDRPLSDQERRWFRQIVQRIAALLVLGEELDRLYTAASADAFTAQELGLVR